MSFEDIIPETAEQPPANLAELYKNGYLEGNPLDPMGHSASMTLLSYMSVLHVIYLRCIKPYINENTVALELGPGTWTKTMLKAKEVWAVDVPPEKHLRFYEYLGHPKHVKYLQAVDLSCSHLPDNFFNYLFSFGCLCHVPFDGITEYAKNLFPKLQSGANCFWMVADYQKLNKAWSKLDRERLVNLVLPKKVHYAPLRWILSTILRLEFHTKRLDPDHLDPHPRPGRWYNAQTERTCAMLEKQSYKVLERDIKVSHRDPIIHFMKP